MDFRVFVEPWYGATYEDQLSVARAAEASGYSAFFRSDHYMAMTGDGFPGSTDAWISLAALARETSTIRLGTMVTSATFRYPGPLAITVAQADEMSSGRVELGIGTGWYEAEHRAYAIPFPPLGERFDRLGEQLDIITGLWSTPPGSRFDYIGKHYSIENSPALPKPVQRPYPPIIIGGMGTKRTPALAAAFGSEFNTPNPCPETAKAAYGRVQRALGERGRESGSVTFSATFSLCIGRDENEVRARAAKIGRDPEELRLNSPLVGTPEEIVDRLGAFTDAGVQRAYVQLLDMSDVDQIRYFADEVVSRL